MMYPSQPYPPQPGYPAYPGAPQGYPQPPAPPQPQSQQAQQPYTAPNIVEPSGGGGGELSPLPRHLIGYAAIILPTAHDPNNMNNGQLRPKVTVDFVVVNIGRDGSLLPPIEYGDSQARDNTARPNCLRLDAFPAEFRGAWWNNEQIVKTLVPLIESRSITMGRFRLGDSNNRPPLIERMDDNDPARAALLEAWQQRTMNPGSLKRSVGQGIVEINGGPPVKAPTGQQGMPPQPGSAYGYPPVAQHGPYAGQALPQTGHVMAQQGQQQGWGGPVAPPTPPQPGAQVQYATPPPPPQPGEYATASAVQMPATAAQAGWTPEAWAAAPPQVKAAFGG